jgi:peptidoglycan/xylan/chitin deacetylase (PgdA/CDA1 family)
MMEVPILMYHSIGGVARSRRYRRFVMPSRLFADQLDGLLAAGLRTVTAGQVIAAAKSGRTDMIPNRAVVLTFDDAFADFESEALPALLERRMVATVFVPTAFVGRRASWLDDTGEGHRMHLRDSQLRAIHAAGFEFGAHSHTHPQLDRLRSRWELADEVRRPRRTLEELLQAPVTTFAYPFGYHSGAVRQAVKDAGYLGAFRVDNVRSRPLNDDLFALPRITVTPRMNGSRMMNAIERRRTLVSDGYVISKRHGWRWARRASAPLCIRRTEIKSPQAGLLQGDRDHEPAPKTLGCPE